MKMSLDESKYVRSGRLGEVSNEALAMSVSTSCVLEQRF